MSGNAIKFSASLDDNVSGKLGKIRNEFDRLGGKGSAASLFGNVGAKAVAVGFNLVGDAAVKVEDILKDALNAGMAMEVSVDKLTASLKANVPAWDGNYDAIEQLISAHDALGFKEGEQRDSLTLLVAATHDVNEAFTVQATAMDLARFKGISLQDASEALTKVEGGSYRILKSLGIVLKDGATQQDALTAVQKVAQGQAETYAATLSGKLAKAQVTIDKGMEHLGEFIMPIVASSVDALSNAFSFLSGDPSYKLTGALGTIADAISHVIGFIKGLLGWVADAARALQSFVKGVIDAISHVDILQSRTRIGGTPTQGVGGHAQGGWVGLHGPEMGIVGEQGPEYIIPNNQLGSMASGGGSPVVLHVNLDGRKIAEVVDKHMYYMLQRAAPTLSRT